MLTDKLGVPCVDLPVLYRNDTDAVDGSINACTYKRCRMAAVSITHSTPICKVSPHPPLDIKKLWKRDVYQLWSQIE